MLNLKYSHSSPLHSHSKFLALTNSQSIDCFLSLWKYPTGQSMAGCNSAATLLKVRLFSLLFWNVGAIDRGTQTARAFKAPLLSLRYQKPVWGDLQVCSCKETKISATNSMNNVKLFASQRKDEELVLNLGSWEAIYICSYCVYIGSQGVRIGGEE